MYSLKKLFVGFLISAFFLPHTVNAQFGIGIRDSIRQARAEARDSIAAVQESRANRPYQRPVATFLVPLHLDSLFQNTRYRFGNSIPRFTLPYLEYYNGMRLAVDSLNEEGIDALVQVVDSRQRQGLRRTLSSAQVGRSNMLIGIALNTADLREMSDFAKARKVPFISTTFPNDGGIQENPYLYILNPTLKTHIHSAYNFLQKTHARDNLLVFTRRGNAEPYLKAWIDEAADAEGSQQLNLKFHTLNDSFSIQNIIPLLDSNRNNTIWGATLTEAFAKRMVKALAPLTVTYPITILGMPTWDGIDFTHQDYQGVDIYISTPFVSSMGNASAFNSFSRRYNRSQNSRASDMASKGYEFTYRLVKALARDSLSQSPQQLNSSLNDKRSRIFNEVDFQPVYAPGKPGVINYYENRKLYFVRKTNGAVRGIY